MGDVRGYAKDRFRFNVIFHMSVIGSLCYLVGGFGWPKPIAVVLGVNVATAVIHLIPLPPMVGGFLVLALIPEWFARAQERFILAGPYLISALTPLDRLYPELFLRAGLDYLA